MLVEPNIDVMLHDEDNGVQNKFALVTLALKRARDINSGSPALVEGALEKKPVTVALEEIYDGKVRLLDNPEEVEPQSVPTADLEAAALAASLGTPIAEDS